MYKIESVEIKGFWSRFDVKCEFNSDVNIVIGKNGTGKTTFMNILHAVLTINTDALSENDFESAKITLSQESGKRTIKATKIYKDDVPFPMVEYQISQRKKIIRLIGADERRNSPALRRHIQESTLDIKKELDSLIRIASLSVYRLRNDDDYEVRDRSGAKVLSPVDYRLSQALRGLTQYQLALSQEAREVSARLQSDVLASILFSEDDAKYTPYELSFDKQEEQSRLITAYQQLNSLTNDVRKKIKFHVSSIDAVVSSIKNFHHAEDNGSHGSDKNIDIKPLEALRKSRRIIELSLGAKEETQKIFYQIDLFLKIIKEFIPDKNFKFDAGLLTVENAYGEIDHARLSSGEKQLIILLVEALLQNRDPYVFLTDEPELSLHIAWQKMIIPAVRKINPNAQIIAATHSPEVASKYASSIFDMESLISG